jgi:AcrR family transcriptional regulator
MEGQMMNSNPPAGRQCILDQARELFLAHGYHGVSVRDIVRACGLSNAALYHHFGSKQNLFVEVFKEHMTKAAQRVQEAGSGEESCRERLARMTEAHARFILESRTEMQTLHRDIMQLDREAIRPLLPDARGLIPSLFAAVLQEGIASGEIRPVDPHRVGVLLLGMTNSLTIRRIHDSATETLAADIDLAISTLFDGIGN